MKRYTIFLFLLIFLTGVITAPAQSSGNKPPKENNIDNPPEISGIPDQVAAVGKPFRAINLWDYTRELDGDEISFSAEGGVNFIVSIDENNFLTVTPPEQYYIGSEMIIVTVQDLTTNQYFDTDTVIYSVREEDNAPVLGDIPGQSIGINGSFADIDLNDYYHEYDGDPVNWKFRILTSPGTDPNPEWSFEPGNFLDQMTITADVFSNGRPADDESGVLAAFINGELRGVGFPSLVGDKYVFHITVYNNYDGDTISFRFYDTYIEKELPVLQKVVFVGEGIPANPQDRIKLEAGNIVIQKQNNFLKIFRPDPQWIGSESAEIRVEDLGTAAQLYDSVLVNFTVNEGIINPIAAPTDLEAVAEGAKINLTWTDNSNNETHFVIQRKDAQMITEYAYTTIGTADANTTFFSDDSVEELKGYTYRIYAVNDETQSGFSNPYSLISGNFIAPATPSGLSGEPYNRRVELSWEPNSESDLAGYILYRGTVSEQEDSFAAVGKEITNYSVRGLENGTPYSFTISSYDTAGNVSLRSEPIVVTPFNHATQNQGGYESIYVNEDAAPDTLYNVADYFTDEDNDTLVYTVTSSDSSVVIPVYSENKIVLNYQPNAFGGALIDVSATDGSSFASFGFGVTVYSVNDPPVITGIPDQVFDEDSSVTIFLNQYVTDVESDTTSIFFDAYLVSELNNSNKIIRGKKENGNLAIEDNDMGITIQIDGETNVATITGDPDMSGEYNVVFVAYDSNEASSEEDTVHITVNPVNDAPVLTQQFPDVELNEDYGTYVISAAVSEHFRDVDRDFLTYSASVSGTGVTAQISGDSLIINTVQDQNGLSKVVVTASDGFISVSDTLEVNLYPVNDAPVLAGIPDQNFNEDDSVHIFLNQYVTDVDNDTTEISFYAYVAQDETEGKYLRSKNVNGNQVIEDNGYGISVYIDGETNVATIKGDPDVFGQFTLGFVAWDPGEESSNQLVPVTINPVNDAPVLISSLPDVELNEDDGEITAVTQIPVYFNDVDEDELTYSVSVTGSIINSRISSDTLYISTIQDKFGAAEVVVTASDGTLSVSDTINVTVHPVNDPPVIAGVPEFIFNEDDSLVVYLNQYVTDVDNDTTEISFYANVVGMEGTIQGKMIKGNGGSPVLDSGPEDLILHLNDETNVLTIKAKPDSFGTYKIQLVAWDPNEASDVDTANVTINPVNDAPVVVQAIEDRHINEDEGEVLLHPDLKEVFVDVDRDALNFSVNASGGIVTARISGDSLYMKTIQDKFGTAKLTVTASDGQYNVSDSLTVYVHPANDAPVITGIPDVIFNEDDSTKLFLNQYAYDVDNDTTELMFDATVLSASSGIPVENVKKGRDEKGNLYLEVGTGDLIISIDEASNVATFNASSDSSGSFTVEFTAYDPDESYDRDTIGVTVNPVNDSPFLNNPIADQNILEDAGDIVVSSSLYNIFGDIDTKVLQFNAQSDGAVISARVSGDSLFIKTANDLYGSNNVVVTASDGQYTVRDTFTVNVIPVNDPPVRTLPISDKFYQEDAGTVTAVNDLKAHFSDIDGDTLTYSVSVFGHNTTAQIQNDALIINTIKDKFGTDTLIVTAYDKQYQVSDTLLVNILPVNDAPVLSGMPDLSFNEDDSTSLNLNQYVYDVDNDTSQIRFTAQVISASNSELMRTIKKYTDGGGNEVIEVGTGDLKITINNLTNTAFIKASPDSNGQFTVVFTAKDDSNATDTDTIDVRVNKVNDPPYVAVPLQDVEFPEDAGKVLINPDLKYNFRDVDFDVLSFYVNSSDGPVNAFISGDSLYASTIQDLFGTDTLIVTASDGFLSISDTLLVNILPVNDAPVLAGMPDLSFNEDDSTYLYLNGYVYDVDNDTTQIRFTADVLTASGESLSQNVRRYIDEKGNSVIEVGTGDLLIAINNTTNVAFIKASADSNGLFTVKFTAKDDSNAVDSDTINVRVYKVNDPPYLAVPLQDVVFPEDAGTKLVNSNLKVNFRDVDFDVLSFSVNSSAGPVEAFISGDSLFVTTIQDLYGTDTLVVTAYDGQYNVSDTLLVNIYPLNDAPVLAGLPDISFSEDDSTSLSLNPFVYDIDNDTTQITFTANVISASNPALLSGIKRYKDEKGNSVTEVGTGDLIITIDRLTNTAHFKASPDSNGIFTIEFTATDDSAATDKDTMVVNVTMVNDPPYVYSPMADTTFLEDAGTMLIVSDLKQHFKDVDFDQLLFSVTTHGIVNAAVTNDNLSVSTIDNLFGVDTLVITASDGQYSVNDTILVNILAVNDAPVLAGLPDITFNEDDSTTINLNNYVYDVDNDTTQIKFMANVFSASNPALLKSIKKYKDKSGYNVIEVGTGDLIIRIDSVTNIAYISSSPDSNGVFGVEFTATDDSSAFSRDTINVFLDAVNDPPYIFAAIADTTFLEDAGEHLIVPDLKYHFRDVDFDTLSFSIGVLNTVIIAELRNDSLFISTKPDYFGLGAIEITASDRQYSVLDTIYVNILPINDPPVLYDIPDISFDEDDSTHLYLNGYLFDVDNDTTQLYFTYTVERINVLPAKVKKSTAIIDEEETVTGKPLVNSANSQALIIKIDSLTHRATFSSGPDSNGVFRVVFTVTDDSGAVAFDSLTVNINPVNDAPVRLAAIKDTTFLEDPGPIVMAPSIYDIFRDIDNPSLDFVVQFSEPGIQYSIIDSVFTIEPDSHYNGTRTAYIFASDGQYTVSDTFNILVRSVNDQPRVSDIPPIIMPEDTIYRFDLDQYVYDPDHDTTELVWMADIIRNTQLENSIRKLIKKALVADEEFYIYQSDNKAVLKTAVDSLIITINTSTHVATIVATLNFSGLDIPVVFTARDPLSLAGNDTTSISVIERNDPPVITGSIPQLTMNEDDSLQVLYTSFYPYISDPETPDSLLGIFATYSGNNFIITHTPLSIQLKPKPNWFGIDTIYLSVTDYIDTVTAPVRVRVNAVNDLPYFLNLPDSVRFRGDSSVTIPLWDYVEDLETPDSLMLFSFNRNNDSLLISYTASTGNLRLSSLWNFGGVVRLIITARDQGNALVRDSIFVYIDKFVGVDDENIIPEVYSLSQNYPNPFNPSTVIRFGLPKEDNVELSVYNIAGERVRTIISEQRNAGVHTVTWDGRNDYGNQLPSGIYFYKMKTSAFNEVKKLIMIK